MEMDEDEIQTAQEDDSRDTIEVNMNWDEHDNDTQDERDDSEEPFHAAVEQSKSAKETLNGIFELLGISPIIDV